MVTPTCELHFDKPLQVSSRLIVCREWIGVRPATWSSTCCACAGNLASVSLAELGEDVAQLAARLLFNNLAHFCQ